MSVLSHPRGASTVVFCTGAHQGKKTTEWPPQGRLCASVCRAAIPRLCMLPLNTPITNHTLPFFLVFISVEARDKMMFIIYFCLGIQSEDQKLFTNPWVSYGRIASLPVSWLTFHSTWSCNLPSLSCLECRFISYITNTRHRNWKNSNIFVFLRIFHAETLR